MKMNKKLAIFLFAIGVGAAAPAFANCMTYCIMAHNACIANGGTTPDCNAELDDCTLSC